MRLITDIEIRSFRSIRALRLQGLDDYIPLLGPNGSGKSNVLRALNLFFNGHLEDAGQAVDLRRDVPDTPKKKRKQLSVQVCFDLDGGYSVRGTQPLLDALRIADQLILTREWFYAPGTSVVSDRFRGGPRRDALRELTPDETALALVFIRSVGFRYIPNHVRPAEMIATELQPLQQELLRRLRQTKDFRTVKVEKAMAALGKVADDMFASVSRDFVRGAPRIRAIEASLPSDFAELAFDVAVRAMSHAGTARAPELEGSGHQSLMLLHLMALIDRTERGKGFGWRQSNVWAIEEPESFLHAGLRARYAEDLRSMAADARRQVIVTTHQDEFVRVADSAWLVDQEDGATACTRLPAREAIRKSARALISTPTHLLLLHPEEPLVFVEGDFDALYLQRALADASIRPRWRLIVISDLDEYAGGGSAIVAWLKANRTVLASRSEAAPVFVLRDWEDTVGGALLAAVESHEFSGAMACPENLCNPDLDARWRGIERYLPTGFVESAIGSRVPALGMTGRPTVQLTRETRERAKQRLARRFREDHPAAGEHLEALARWLNDEVEARLTLIPQEFFARA